MNFLSLGAGVQSSTMALMAAKSELGPMPDAAIFSDTQWEPKAVYDWLDWLETQLPFPVVRVTAGSLRDAIVSGKNSTGQKFAPVPWFVRNPDGSEGMGRRQCTREFKIDPVRKAKRALLGYEPGKRIPVGSCVTWIGISTDEAARMKPSRERWNVNRHPLIEVGMSRGHCLAWMAKNGYPQPPKSSCIGCPYHSDHEWRQIKSDPDAWKDAIYIDGVIRDQDKKRKQFMHKSMKPLGEVDLTTAEESGQFTLWDNECEGMCGV